MDNFSITNLQPSNMFKLIFPYYRNQTGNMGPYYPFEGAPLHPRQTHHANCALRVFALNAH